MAQEWHRDGYTISTDKMRLDLELIHTYLSRQSYWAQGRLFETVQTSIARSLCFGLYEGSRQVGFARVVTDHATFGWLCDVFVVESHRGRGLGKWLVERVVTHPDISDLRHFVLATRDAHGLYHRYGEFDQLDMPEKWMIRKREERLTPPGQKA
jgi:GNAT superfamily N-acetyltransferase